MPPSSHQPVIDWSVFAVERHDFTTDQLLSYNATGVDPYLIQIAQIIGSRFKLALQGQRNLANAFASLPLAEFYGRRMGIGFSDRQVARLLSTSEGGFVFLGICGCLCEYFAEDVVVGVIMLFLRSFQTPRILPELEPSDAQWRKLVQLCHGALATSPFGVLITRGGPASPVAGEHVNLTTIVDGLVSMSLLVGGDVKHISIHDAGPDAHWFAAVAEYLFDLRVVIQDPSGAIIYSSSGENVVEPQLNIRAEPATFGRRSIDLWPLSQLYPGELIATGGRVTWEKLFRSCFGKAFTDIENSLLAEFVGGAASLTSATLKRDNTNAQAYFLPQASSIPGLSGHGLVETLTSWFPELRRLAPQMERVSRLPFQQARDKMDDVSVIIDSSCMCSTCGNAPPTSTDFCKHSLVEVVMHLGLFIARAVVIPNLFPKRSGMLSIYERYHAGRVAYKAAGKRLNEPEAFMDMFAAALPTTRTMIETMCLLFAGTVPTEITDNTLAIAHDGLFVSVNAWNPNSGTPDPLNDHVLIRQRAGVAVSTGSSHLYGRIYNHSYWARAGLGNETDEQSLSFSESLELLRTRPHDLVQIVKPKDGQLMFSFVQRGIGKEERAARLGWQVMV